MDSRYLNRVASSAPSDALATILTALRALAWIHQAHHWQTRGDTFYGDHLLFDRLYNDIVEEVDSLAERCVGLAGVDSVDPVLQATVMASFVRTWCTGTGSYAQISLGAEEDFLNLAKSVATSLKANQGLSRGTDNLLAGIEDKHESHVYLLKQRLDLQNQ